MTRTLAPDFGGIASRDWKTFLRAEHDAAFATWLTAFEEGCSNTILDTLDNDIWAIETAMRRGAP